MVLRSELGLKKTIKLAGHEAVLNIYYTASCMKKKADEFFRRFGLTDVQFNVMTLLVRQADPENGGLSQAQLSDMMLVNRANITSLIDRMEKADLVVRTDSPQDRRYNIIKLTGRGKKLFVKVDPLYVKEVKNVMSILETTEQKSLIRSLEKIRTRLKK